jgi:protein-disulfide isomerase
VAFGVVALTIVAAIYGRAQQPGDQAAVDLATKMVALEKRQQELESELDQLKRMLDGVNGKPSSASRKQLVPTEPLYIAASPSKGSPSAEVVVVELSDFQCPYCRKFAAESLPLVFSELVQSGEVQYVFRNLPLEELHPRAALAAKAAECAFQQGRFWEMHDLLYSSALLTDEAIIKNAVAIGVSIARFTACNAAPVSTRVLSEAQEARRLGIASTPTFLIGTRTSDGRVRVAERLSGALPYPVFRAVVERVRAGASGHPQ